MSKTLISLLAAASIVAFGSAMAADDMHNHGDDMHPHGNNAPMKAEQHHKVHHKGHHKKGHHDAKKMEHKMEGTAEHGPR